MSNIKMPTWGKGTPPIEIEPDSIPIILPNLKEKFEEDSFLDQLHRGRPINGCLIA